MWQSGILALLLQGGVTLAKSLDLSEPQIPLLIILRESLGAYSAMMCVCCFLGSGRTESA